MPNDPALEGEILPDDRKLPAAPALLGPITRGADLLYAIPEEALAAA